METMVQLEWDSKLIDPIGKRDRKSRSSGKTMVMDKGLGLHAFEDMLEISNEYIDMIKIGFGTSALYRKEVLKRKIELAKLYAIPIFPGGTFLEVAICQNAIDSYFQSVKSFGFTAIEVSDGTISLSRNLRNSLISWGVESDLNVITEYGKKSWGSTIDIEDLIETIQLDAGHGAVLVTIEGRESGKGVGIFDEEGNCKKDDFQNILNGISNPNIILWEAPLKNQQVELIKTLGPQVNIGNISPEDILSLEALWRGLRSDTLVESIRLCPI